jgi:aspartokinase
MHEKKKVAQIPSALLEKNLDVEFIKVGSSPITALYGIKENQSKEVIHTLYDVLFR